MYALSAGIFLLLEWLPAFLLPYITFFSYGTCNASWNLQGSANRSSMLAVHLTATAVKLACMEFNANLVFVQGMM
jgi:hypothetical protein